MSYPGKMQATTKSLRIDPALAKLVPAMTVAEIVALEQSIREKGILEPLVVDEFTHVIYDGHHRFAMAKQLGLPFVPIYETTFKTKNAAKLFVIENLLMRRHLTIWQRAKLAMAYLQIAKKTVKKGRPKKGLPAGKKEAAELAAEKVGIATRTFYRAKVLIEKAPKDVIEKLDQNKLEINTAYNQITQKPMEIKKIKLPAGKYNVWYADPPWQYDNKNTGGSLQSGANKQYPTMSLDSLARLYDKFKDHLANDAVLFLWATVPMLPDALDLMRAWGFKYVTMLTWYKTGKLGLGFWFRGATEHLLVGTRGNVKPFNSQAPNIVLINRTGHSEKPEIFRSIIETATKKLGRRRFIELFARKQVKGWKCVGNEIDK